MDRISDPTVFERWKLLTLAAATDVFEGLGAYWWVTGGHTIDLFSTLRLTDPLAADLEAIGRVENVPVAEEVRRALTEHIASRRSDTAFQGRLRKSIERNQEILRRLATD